MPFLLPCIWIKDAGFADVVAARCREDGYATAEEGVGACDGAPFRREILWISECGYLEGG
jgi:hypothetical protein